MGEKDDRPARAFGQVISEIRAARSLSQEKLALNCNLDRTYVSLLERGKRQPTITSIFKLAIVIDIPACELVKQASEILEDMGWEP